MNNQILLVKINMISQHLHIVFLTFEQPNFTG